MCMVFRLCFSQGIFRWVFIHFNMYFDCFRSTFHEFDHRARLTGSDAQFTWQLTSCQNSRSYRALASHPFHRKSQRRTDERWSSSIKGMCGWEARDNIGWSQRSPTEKWKEQYSHPLFPTLLNLWIERVNLLRFWNRSIEIELKLSSGEKYPLKFRKGEQRRRPHDRWLTLTLYFVLCLLFSRLSTDGKKTYISTDEMMASPSSLLQKGYVPR